jgi:HlyD family type I secretion membrane fusion protein
MANKRKYLAGDFIFEEGETGGYAYVVEVGEVEIVKLTPEGLTVLATLEKATLFGEMAIIEGGLRSAGARAKSDVLITEIDSENFLLYLSQKPNIALNLLKKLSSNLRESNRKLTDLMRDQASNKALISGQRDIEAGNKKSPLEEFTQVTNDPEAIYDKPASRAHVYSGMMILLMIFSTLVFSIVSFVDTTVSTRGKFVTSVSNVEVQASKNSVITKIRVRQGDRVKKDQILASLDPSDVDSDLKIIALKLNSTRQRIKRLSLEEENLKGEKLSENIKSKLNSSSKDILSKKINEYDSLRNLINVNSQQVELKRQVMEAHEKLFKKGAVSRLALIQAKDSLLAVTKVLSQSETTLSTKNATIVEQLQAEKEAEVQLREEQKALVKVEGKLLIRAPVDAIVLDVPIQSEGSIVKEGQIVVKLVPRDVPLVLEVDVDPKDISDLKVGAEVSVKLDALPFQQFGDISGKLVFVSEDTFSETLTGEKKPVYRARVDLDQESVQTMRKKADLTPGMLAKADFRVGERRLITYFTNPITKGLDSALEEPN